MLAIEGLFGLCDSLANVWAGNYDGAHAFGDVMKLLNLTDLSFLFDFTFFMTWFPCDGRWDEMHAKF